MSLETPKGYEKRESNISEYTSPIGLLKNHSATNNHYSNSNSYEQQFFRIKSKRLETELQKLTDENNILRAKLNDSNTMIEILKQKVLANEQISQRAFTNRTNPVNNFGNQSSYYQGFNTTRNGPNQSGYFSANEKNQKNFLNTQIERLLKENRTLKNQYEVEISNLKQDNKKLQRKILELQVSQKEVKSNSNEQEIKRKIQQKYNRLQKINGQLRKQGQQLQKDKKRIEEKLHIVEQNNKALRRQNQQIKIFNNGKNRADATIKQLEILLQRQKNDYQSQVKELNRQIEELKKIKSYEALSASRYSNHQNRENIKINIQNTTQQQSNTGNSKQVQYLRRKVLICEQNVKQKDEQIKSVLIKLKPLLQKQKTNKDQIETQGKDTKRASLSILQVFLKKYKITAF